MPITPFHFGPGGLITLASRGHVSFLAFCAANVLIDVESLYNMVTGQLRIHTFFHTYVGAMLAAVVVVLGFYPARRLANLLPVSPLTAWRHLPVRAVVWGALLGAWTHVLLDSIMHPDITPLAPFSNVNVLYGAVTMGMLHLSCLLAGVAAVAWWIFRFKSVQR